MASRCGNKFQPQVVFHSSISSDLDTADYIVGLQKEVLDTRPGVDNIKIPSKMEVAPSLLEGFLS